MHKYTFTNRCKECSKVKLNDGAHRIVLNAKGTAHDVSEELKAFLDYVGGIKSEDEYVKKLDEAVRRARANKEWSREYIMLHMRDWENQEIGLEKGLKRGRRQGRRQGREDRDKEMISGMIRKGKSPQEISEFCGYPLSLVEEVQKGLLAAR